MWKMSINVKVKGNSTSKSGKMASFSEVSNEANKEITKRRQIRLQQVRQQSKDIAQNIREKVKKEHEKQISQASHDNSTKLKQWQNRKLLQLENQYQEGLGEIGLGHMQAAEEQKRDDDALEKQEKRKEDAKDRGFQASQKLQITKNEQNMKKALPIQTKKFAREVEKTRAAMVSKIKSKSPRKLQEQQKGVETACGTESDVAIELQMPSPVMSKYPGDETSTSQIETHSVENSDEVTATIISPRIHTSADIPPTIGKSLPIKYVTQPPKSSVQDAVITQFREQERLARDPTDGAAEILIRQFHMDTRISDRIKRRLLPFSEADKVICGSRYNSEYAPTKSVCCPCPNRNIVNNTVETDTRKLQDLDIAQNDVISKSTIPKLATSDKAPEKSKRSQTQTSKTIKDKGRLTTSNLSQPIQSGSASEKIKGVEVPIKPAVALIPSNETVSHLHSLPSQPTNVSRVQYYDHKNRFNSEYLTDNVNVQKISDENLVQLSNLPDDVPNSREIMVRRDREAQIRGQKALEKERIHREYNELLQKLPVLQKQERIACLCKDKPTFHMNRQRLHETEIKRQNVMENAYENLFVNAGTLPPNVRVVPDPNNMPFVTVHNPKIMPIQSREENIHDFQAEGDQTSLLQTLLQNLQQQKEMLQQLGSLPGEKNAQIVANDDVSNESKNPSKRRFHKVLSECECISVKPLILQNTSTQTSPAQTSRTTTDIVASSPKRPHRSISSEVDESTAPKKAKKTRNKIPHNVIDDVDANVAPASIMTSAPTKCTNERGSSLDSTDLSFPMRMTKPSKTIHKCKCTPQIGCDQLCEIRIRIQENEKPEIIISSPKKNKNTREESSSKPMLKAPYHSEPTFKPTLKAATRSDPSCKHTSKASARNDRKRSKCANKCTPKRGAINKTPLSWGEHFTQNSLSSSTTYYSPPTTQYSNSVKPNMQKGTVKSKSTTDPPTASKKQIDRRLMTYISKLLDMSKAQIDDLNVSTVSDVTTPSSSIIECSTNRPMKQLMNVMKLFKLSPLDVATNLNYSKESSPGNSTNTNSISSTSRADANKSGESEPAKSHIQYSDSSASSKYCSENSRSNNEPAGFIKKYAQMADICHQRISDLTAEIEKIRQEKQQILENHSESDKENSTVYCNLPSQFGQDTNQPISPNSLKDQEVLNKKLLRIKNSSASDPNTPVANYEEIFRDVDDIDKDILDRYIKLKADVNNLVIDLPKAFEQSSHILAESSPTFSSQLRDNQIVNKDFHIDANTDSKNVIFGVDSAAQDILDALSTNKSDINKLTVGVPVTSDNRGNCPEIGTELRNDLFFVPLLDDIPRLPKLGTSSLPESQTTFHGRRPPPSKGLIAARKFKGDIIAPPHELSTIAEADSLISTKFNLKQTADTSNVGDKENDKKSTKSCSSTSSISLDESMPDVLAELIRNVNVKDDLKGDVTKRSDTDTSTEKSDLETIENMLRSIGMDWAIATLRKTRHTLGRDSSSSSSNGNSVMQLDCPNNHISISKVGVCGIGSSCSIADSHCSSQSSCSSFCKEIDLSQISGGASNIVDKGNRTSTPVQTSKRKSKPKHECEDVITHVITDDSDNPSVSETMDDQYLTIPDVSLKSQNRTE